MDDYVDGDDVDGDDCANYAIKDAVIMRISVVLFYAIFLLSQIFMYFIYCLFILSFKMFAMQVNVCNSR